MKVYPVHNSFFGKKEWDFDNEARIFLRSLSLIKKNKDELLIKDYYNRNDYYRFDDGTCM